MTDELSAIERYNHLARQGAAVTADSLGQLTGATVRSRATDVRLTVPAGIADRLGDRPYVAIQADFDGHLDGAAAIAIAREDVRTVTETMGADDALHQSGLETIGNLAVSGFVDVLANAFQEAIYLTPPRVVEGAGAEVLPLEEYASDEWIITIASQLELVDHVLDLELVMLPDGEGLFHALDPSDRDGSALERIVRIGDLAREGTEQAAGHLSMMTGLEADLALSRLRFATVEAIPTEADPGNVVGTVFELEDAPGGYLALLFEEEAAKRVVDAMVPTDDPFDDWAGMDKSAIEELGNVTTSGLIDGWAEAQGSTIAHSPPEFVADDRVAILGAVANRLALEQSTAVIGDAAISLDGGAVACEIYLLPRHPLLREALDDLMSDDRTDGDG